MYNHHTQTQVPRRFPGTEGRKEGRKEGGVQLACLISYSSSLRTTFDPAWLVKELSNLVYSILVPFVALRSCGIIAYHKISLK